jgi:hypothetical protein
LVDELPLRGLLLEKVLKIEIRDHWDSGTCLTHVRRNCVAVALDWLKSNNPSYTITINPSFLDVLPDCGMAYHLLPIIQGNRGEQSVCDIFKCPC